MNQRTQLITGLMILGLLLGVLAGCAPQPAQPTVAPATQPAATLPDPTQSAPTLLPDWVTYSASGDQGRCGYSIDHPSDMDVASQGTYSWTLRRAAADGSDPAPSFVYISVIPDDFQSSEPGAIYNYDPAEAQTLLDLQVGASGSLRDDPNLASSFTYTRLPDTTLGSGAAQGYENPKPWEFPEGTKEIRYYLKGNGCTYLIGGYLASADSGQSASIDQSLFDQIVATFRQGS